MTSMGGYGSAEESASLRDTSIVCRFDQVQYAVHLADGCLRMRALPGFSGATQNVEVHLRYVLSAVMVETFKSRRPVFSQLDFFSRPRNSCDAPLQPSLHLRFARRTVGQKWRAKTIVLDFESADFGVKVCENVNAYIVGLTNRPKRLMFFVNPISGGGNAMKIMAKSIVPLLTDIPTIQYDQLVTTHAGHAREWLLERPSVGEIYDGIIAVGGDGIFNECVEGVITQAQDTKISAESQLNSPRVRVGIIPAGSTDSIGFCIGLVDPVTALIHILLGDHMMLDVGAVFRAHDRGFAKFFCAFLGYGFFSDTLRNSEKQWLRRYLGKTRYMLAGAKTFFLNRAYPGYISYLPADPDPEGYPDEGLECVKDCPVCTGVAEKKSSACAFSFSNDETLDRDWVTLDGRFTNVIAVSLCCKSEKSPKGLAPTSHCGDGCLSLLVVKKLGHFRLLNYLISTSRGIGPRRVLGESLHACRAYELVFRTKNPVPASDGGPGQSTISTTVWNCDGEIIFEPEIHVK